MICSFLDEKYILLINEIKGVQRLPTPKDVLQQLTPIGNQKGKTIIVKGVFMLTPIKKFLKNPANIQSFLHHAMDDP